MSVPHSVGFNNITGDGADSLAKVVLEHTTLTNFCSIPLVSLRKNTLTELNLSGKGIGVPGAIVLSSLLPSALALHALKYATTRPKPLSAATYTPTRLSFAASWTTSSGLRVRSMSPRCSLSTARSRALSTPPSGLCSLFRYRQQPLTVPFASRLQPRSKRRRSHGREAPVRGAQDEFYPADAAVCPL